MSPFKLFRQIRKSQDPVDQSIANAKGVTRKDLIAAEAELGGKLFGEVKAGNSREFFCLDEHTWVWSETKKDGHGRKQTSMTRYEIRGDKVMKVQNGTYFQLSFEEKKHLKKAIEMYSQQVVNSMYVGTLNASNV